jgi:hypothetical protein
MGSSLTSLGSIPVLRCLVIFNDTNYLGWVSRMRLHMRGLRLWEFLTDELPYPLSPSTPVQHVISEKTTATEKDVLIADYEDPLALYESQYSVCMTWLDEDTRDGSVHVASMEDRFSAEIVELERCYQMWTFLCSRYEPTR